MLRVNASISIPESELAESFIRAAGPGGQHVNRTESAVELRFDVRASAALPEAVRQRLLASTDRRISQDGVLVIQARRFRDQRRNRDDARERLRRVVLAATQKPKRRIPTRPTRASRERRLSAKARRGAVKRDRGRDWSRE